MFTPPNNRDCHFTQSDSQNWMKKALELAKHSLPDDVPVGAIILKKTQNGFSPIASGFNQREKQNQPSKHAEMIALDQAAESKGNWRLDDCILVVTLEPCAMCCAAILQARVPTIIFGAYSPIDGALGSKLNLPLTLSKTSPQVIAGVLEDECKTLLKQCFKH